MILIEIRGKVFNPEKIQFLQECPRGSEVYFSEEEPPALFFENVTPNVLAAEINNAIYDHEYFLEVKRIEARHNFTNPMEK